MHTVERAAQRPTAVQRVRSTTRRRMAQRLVSVLVLCAGFVVGVSVPIASDVATAPPAGAYCPPGSSGGGIGTWWGVEWSVGGTCDWDNTYHGSLLDAATDGSCVYSEFIDAGYWNVQAYACTTGVWIDYWKWDYDGDFYSQLIMCRDYNCFSYWVDNYGY